MAKEKPITIDGVITETLPSAMFRVEVEIGGEKIDKHYTKWMDIYNELFEMYLLFYESFFIYFTIF